MPDPTQRTLIPHDRSEVDALKASVDLAAFIEASGVPLRRVGQNLLGRCPFHEDAEASLSVNSERQLFNYVTPPLCGRPVEALAAR